MRARALVLYASIGICGCAPQAEPKVATVDIERCAPAPPAPPPPPTPPRVQLHTIYELPESMTVSTDNPIWVVAILADGQMVLGAKTVTEAELSADLERLLQQRPALRVVVTADRGIAFGKVVHAVDVVKRAGVRQVALAADVRPK